MLARRGGGGGNLLLSGHLLAFERRRLRAEHSARRPRITFTVEGGTSLEAVRAPDGAGAKVAIIIITDGVLCVVVAVVAEQARLRIKRVRTQLMIRDGQSQLCFEHR
jgi:hypothetical protein